MEHVRQCEKRQSSCVILQQRSTREGYCFLVYCRERERGRGGGGWSSYGLAVKFRNYWERGWIPNRVTVDYSTGKSSNRVTVFYSTWKLPNRITVDYSTGKPPKRVTVDYSTGKPPNRVTVDCSTGKPPNRVTVDYSTGKPPHSRHVWGQGKESAIQRFALNQKIYPPPPPPPPIHLCIFMSCLG